MSKISIDDIKAQFASVNSINLRFQQIENEFNNKVLYRDNPVNEPNAMSNDLDMNEHDIINIGELYKDGNPVIIPALTWGNIGGDISEQADLYAILVNHNERIINTEEGLADLEGANFQNQIDVIDTELGNHTSQSIIHIPMDDFTISAGSLYSSNKIEQLIVGALVYKGQWDASLNDPFIADGTGVTGYFYVVSVAGTQDLGSGDIIFNVGDNVIHDGTVWNASTPATIGDATTINYDPTGNLVIQPASTNVDLALTDLDAAIPLKENLIGNPTVDGHTLASTVAGVRSWVPLIEGPAGSDGTDGVDGTDGLPGATGAPGEDGDDGLPGTPGTPGVDGIDGLPGADGDDGAPGLPGDDGIDGTNGIAATVDVGVTTKVPAGGNPLVTNTGDTTNAVFDFAIVTGDTGPQGAKGDAGTGINLLGQEDVAVVITLTALAIGDSYVSTTAGLDSEGSAVAIDDVIRAIDTLAPSTWVNIGPIVGPQGIQGEDGEQGIQGIQGEDGIQGVAGNDGAQGIQGEKGDIGDTGLTGDDGIDGTNGTAATIVIGTVVGLPAGTAPEVVNVGTPSAAVFDFGLEQGENGIQGTPGTNGTDGDDGLPGIDGVDGAVGPVGPDGTAATIAVGQVTDVVPNGAATVVNVGTSLDAVFDFGIVTGDTGAQGIQGEVGPIGPAGGIATGIVYDPTGNLVIDPASLEVDAALTDLDVAVDANITSIGAVSNALTAHENDVANPHSVTAGQTGADTSTEVDAKVATAEPANANIQAHIIDVANPHTVTASQTGAPTVAEMNSAISATLQALYPVGSVFLGANPTAVIGGTWAQVPEGTFIMSTVGGADGSGGTNYLTLSEAQLPAHIHAKGGLTFAGTPLANHNHTATFAGAALGNHSHAIGVGSTNGQTPYLTGGAGTRSNEIISDEASAGTPAGTVTNVATGAGTPAGAVNGNVASTGGDGSFNNRPRYIGREMWERTA